MAEQSTQLYLKATILENTGEFPRTHSIRQLFGLIYNLTKDERIKYDRKSLTFLEGAYFNARYFTFSYEKEDAIEALKIVEEIKNIIRIIGTNEKKKGND